MSVPDLPYEQEIVDMTIEDWEAAAARLRTDAPVQSPPEPSPNRAQRRGTRKAEYTVRSAPIAIGPDGARGTAVVRRSR